MLQCATYNTITSSLDETGGDPAVAPTPQSLNRMVRTHRLAAAAPLCRQLYLLCGSRCEPKPITLCVLSTIDWRHERVRSRFAIPDWRAHDLIREVNSYETNQIKTDVLEFLD